MEKIMYDQVEDYNSILYSYRQVLGGWTPQRQW